MFFKKRLVELKIPKIGILIEKDVTNEYYSYSKFFKNYFIKNNKNNQVIILSYKKINAFSYDNLALKLENNFTISEHNNNIYYHFYKRFPKENVQQYEWYMIKNSFLVNIVTTMKISDDEALKDEFYTDAIDFIKRIH